MSDDAAPPAPSVEAPDGWIETASTTERLFSVTKVTVTATTVVYEDERLRSQDGGAFRRFVFASRLRLRPSTKPSKPLTKLVTSRAKAGFADRLADRGMRDVDVRETRRFRVDGTDATLVGYDAACEVAGTDLAVDGWVAIWPDDDGDYFVAGGAYPTRVLDGDSSQALEPNRYRDDLFSILRSVR
ncbi:DUF6517 family protein [Salinigranum sp. GCM10025319]|uniref:DUF6517 family protein n=1 Tax=Salinigranum sp. GCM10025319 TaxID=3252687 RepID=UPI003614117A